MSTNPTPARQSPFQSILNFRDVGQFINRAAGQRMLKEGLLYRSAKPDKISPSDRDKFHDEYRIKNIVDLRGKPQKYHSRGLAKVLYSDLNGGAYSRALLKQLTWSQYFRLIYLVSTGHRNEGITILGENVMRQRGLTGLAIDTVKYSGSEFKRIFQLLADETNYPVLLHCFSGKDRTGITVVLILLLLQLPLDPIKKDYMLSQSELEPEKESRVRELRKIGLPESFTCCDESLVKEVSNYLEQEHGSVQGYLSDIGVNKHQQDSIVRILLADS